MPMRVPVGRDVPGVYRDMSAVWTTCAGRCGELIKVRDTVRIHHTMPDALPCIHSVCDPDYQLYMEGVLRLRNCNWSYAT